MRGTKREIKKNIEAKVSARLHNRFDIEVMDAVTGKVKQRAQAENVICAGLWTRLMVPDAYFNYIHIGTGSGTPAGTDTSLFTFLSYKTPNIVDDVYSFDDVNGVGYLKRKVVLNPEDAVGAVITEIGVAYGTSAANLCTHAMLQDMNGNQISITKSGTDLINIYATVFVHWNPAGYDDGNIFISYEGTYSFIKYLLGLYQSNNSGPPTCMQLSPGVSRISEDWLATCPAIAGTLSYSVANKTITFTAGRISAAINNIGGAFYAILYSRLYGLKGYNPAMVLKAGGSWYSGATITGEAVGTGDGTTQDFATDFPSPENATVYIDGVQQTSGVTVNTVPNVANDIGRYFIGLKAESTPTNHILVPNPILSSADNSFFEPSGTDYYYNPFFEIGIQSIYLSDSAIDVYCSNDFANWELPFTTTTFGTFTIPSGYKNYKYWKFVNAYTGAPYIGVIAAASPFEGKAIHFDTAPALGAAITADYTTKAIAKDENHVFDVQVVISLGEYSE